MFSCPMQIRANGSSTPRRFAFSGVVALAFGLNGAAIAGGPIHVDASRPAGSGDGLTWATAFGGPGGLQSALGTASSGDEIWVADGSYLPSTTGSRTASFVLRPGVSVYGGFDGDEVARDERDPSTFVAVLSGDLAGNDVGAPGNDNSFHVVSASGSGITPASRLDGFTIRGGNANGGGDPNDRGGGIIVQNGADPVIARCIFDGNRCTFGGGAGYVRNASPRFEDCVFVGNVGGNFGGAFDIFSSGGPQVVRLVSSVFIDNRAGRAGGIELFGNVTGEIDGCLVANNTATGQGGGIWVGNGAIARVRQSTVAENTAGATPGIHVAGATLTVDNTILFNPSGPEINTLSGPVLRSCLVEGGWSGAGSNNIDGDPRLVDPRGGSAELAPGSAAADAGDNTRVPAGLLADLTGNPRFVDDPCAIDSGVPGGAGGSVLVDIGAGERVSPDLDCNANGIADDCEIADGSVADCDGNGVPDSCDIANGADDCNANGTPDTCEVARDVVIESGVLSPFGSGAPQSLVIEVDGPAEGEVVIDLAAVADLDLAFEIVAVELAGVSLGNVFGVAGNCSDPASTEQIVMTADQWNAIVTPGTPATLVLTPNGAVDPNDCGGGSSVSMTVDLTVAGSNDADGDGIPDDCTGACAGDVDGDLEIGLSDLLSVLGTWGPCPAPCDTDIDADGEVELDDLLAVLANWGPCV